MELQTKRVLLRIGGGISILFMVFHAAFYWLFNWAQALQVLSVSDRGILLTFNLIGILLLGYSVVVTLGFTKQLLENTVGKSILLFFSGFYLVRIFSEVAYFGFEGGKSVLITILCLVPMLCFSLPVFIQSKQPKNLNP